ncbi:TA system VapC family ribonuclease toxin [Brevundimonas sp. SORGH_AS_0993]|uniref:TA system VapC family ribonuclease toxin n=1 Tax=Brevundimonas sp. SORGH_AS_0993 TaxID=3041794 RepID=UPI00277EF1EA|nr:TA system VapC family ribonuclease toxin [Brevundimonas sp. SORGH_AS_0993]MDQ1154407.1 toxin-antitoxin system PIN domain toxin [Brevundimonas sp. SORGH_AS_0993]
MTYLLDVNVLIALVDPRHVFHDAANDWFQREAVHAWATCPITENGLVRIVGSPRYRNPVGPPSEVARILNLLRDMEGHVFWPDAVSLADKDRFDISALTAAEQVTDAYLLALAVSNGGRLATFDRRLSPNAVKGGREALHLIAA